MKFKVGDRVRVYGIRNMDDAGYLYKGFTGQVWKIEGDGELSVKHVDNNQNNETVFAHPKQCRKLKQKTDLRIRFRLGLSEVVKLINVSRGPVQLTQWTPESGENYVQFIEVKKK